MKFLYQLFLAFNSTYLIVVVFLVKDRYTFNFLRSLPDYFSWILFASFPIILTAVSFLIAKRLPKDNLSSSSIEEIELANNNFLPTYLGYFFVSLGVNGVPTLVVVFIMIYIFTFLSQTLYFNPIFLLFGYHFYFINTSKRTKIFLITKKELKTPGNDGFNNLRRINNYIHSSIYNWNMANYIYGKVKRKQNLFRILATDTDVYDVTNLVLNGVEYNPSTLIEEEELYQLSTFSTSGFSRAFLSSNADSVNYDQINKVDLKSLSFICTIQNGLYLFQIVNSSFYISKKWFSIDELELENNKPIITINPIADAIYDKQNDILYFKKAICRECNF